MEYLVKWNIPRAIFGDSPQYSGEPPNFALIFRGISIFRGNLEFSIPIFPNWEQKTEMGQQKGSLFHKVVTFHGSLQWQTSRSQTRIRIQTARIRIQTNQNPSLFSSINCYYSKVVSIPRWSLTKVRLYWKFVTIWTLTWKSTLSEGLAHSTVHHHLRQLSVYLQSGALIFISELQAVC